MKKGILFSLLCTVILPTVHGRTTIKINTQKVVAQVSPLIYGSGMEDVNHEVYGGIYDQRIFGESFEEGPALTAITDFTGYDSPWLQAEEGRICTYAVPYNKLIYDKAETEKGWAETVLRYDGMSGHAGLLIHAQAVGQGKENMKGYEICLSAWTREVILNKYDGTCRLLKRVSAEFEPTAQWNTLHVDFEKATFHVQLNGKEILTFTDDEHPFTQGRLGLRTQDANVTFQNMSIHDGKGTRVIPFETRNNGLSRQWKPVEKGGATGLFRIDTGTAANGRQSQVLENPGVGLLGISNAGLNQWGIAFSKGRTLQGSISLKGHARKVYLALENKDGSQTYATCKIHGISNNWKAHHFLLKPTCNDPHGRFTLYIEGKGKLWADQAMLFAQKKDQFGGLPFRKDIAQGLIDEGLTFLRYGGSMVNSPEYMTAAMMGERRLRPPYRGTWYRESTNGFGIIEFVQLAEAAGMESSFAINMEDNPDDVAQMIEYFNGDTHSTAGGRLRAQDGHPLPYNVKYVELGNEEVIQKDTREGYQHYIERYNLLTQAMKKVDPQLLFICSAWWRPRSLENMEMVFRALDGNCAYWDYHPGVDNWKGARNVLPTLQQMQQLFLQWNPRTKMKCAIFEENGNIHNIQRMLGHEITMNAVRKMGNFVLTSCQANALQPNGQNDNGWDQGQVFFNSHQVWHQPTSYCVQMDKRWHQPQCVECIAESNPLMDVAAMLSEDRRTLVLHIVNTSPEQEELEVDLSCFGHPRKAIAETMHGNLQAENTDKQPQHVIPQTIKATTDGRHTIAPHSYTLLIYKR